MTKRTKILLASALVVVLLTAALVGTISAQGPNNKASGASEYHSNGSYQEGDHPDNGNHQEGDHPHPEGTGNCSGHGSAPPE